MQRSSAQAGHKRSLSAEMSTDQTLAKRQRQSGALQHIVDKAAAKTVQSRQQRAEVVHKIKKAAQDALGSTTHVMKAGSQQKHTDIAASDLDVLVDTRKPMTKEDKTRLASTLRDRFGQTCVHERRSTLQLNLPTGKVDVVPRLGDFVPGGERPLPADPFHNNPAGRQAVRAVKLHAEKHRHAWSGHQIEQAVLARQRSNPNEFNFELSQAVITKLRP